MDPTYPINAIDLLTWWAVVITIIFIAMLLVEWISGKIHHKNNYINRVRSEKYITGADYYLHKRSKWDNEN